MTTLKTVAQDQIKAFLERIERLEEEKQAIADDIKAVYAELKAEGFDTKTMRGLVKARKKDANERTEEEALLATYMHAVGMVASPPLSDVVGAMATDAVARDSVIDAFKQLVPPTGEIICKIGGPPIRLWRDDKGVAQVEVYVEAKAPPKERVGKSLKPSATVLSIVPTSPEEQIKRAADAAQRRADEAATKKPPADAPAADDSEHEDA